MANGQATVDQIIVATKGFEALLNNDLKTANTILSANQDSAFSLVGLGLSSFLAAVLSREDDEVQRAVEVLTKAETIASAECNSKNPKGCTVYPPGTEYKLLVADASIAQALISLLSESYSQFIGAVWKLNKSYKTFSAVAKAVFPDGVDENETLHTIVTKLNNHYLEKTTNPSPAPDSVPSTPSSFFPWRKRVNTPTNTLKHAASSPALSALAHKHDDVPSSSTPGSRVPSRGDSPENLAKASVGKGVLAETGEYPTPLWEKDTLNTTIISGAALGSGMFGLIFSMLPPKARKLISWFGFSGSGRPAALKLLTVSAATGSDVHGYFATLTLLTYYCFVLLMSGWQADEQYLVKQCEVVLNRIVERFPNGTLWILNRAKLARMKYDSDTAIDIIEASLKNDSQFREADSLLVFELCWLYLCQARYLDAANEFEKMCEMNNWSHATYIAIAAGALVDMPQAERTPEIEKRIDALFTKLPSLFGQKRLFGDPPVTETFIARRLEQNKAKRARWIAAGRLPADAKVWEAIRISNAMELGLFWASFGGRSPAKCVLTQIAHLTAMSPLPKYSPTSPVLKLNSLAPPAPPASAPPSPRSAPFARLRSTSSAGLRRTSSSTSMRQFTADDLDSLDEVAIRDLLLGALYTSIGDAASLSAAKSLLKEVIGNAPNISEERWVVPFSMFHLAVALLKEAELKMTEVGANELAIWRPTIDEVEKQLDAVFLVGEYDFKSRIEQRVLMLRDEVAQKKKMLRL
ncbi:hypothetical protein JCM1841_000901 [Sporobolomyces salmonicolor]